MNALQLGSVGHAHIVLLTTQQLCIPAPLGSGSCGGGLGPGGLLPPGLGTGAPTSAPDSKAPRLLHLDVSFGYGEGMGVLLDTFPHYKQQLRPGARTHLVLTEDGAPPMSAEAVVEHIEGRTSTTGSPPWMPALAPDSWVFSGVLCTGGGGLTCALSLIPPTTTPRKMGACAEAEAWRYDDDDAPTKILLCPRACELVRAQADAELNVEFGCETIVI